MQRPRNRQGRPPVQQERGRGRGRGRGGGFGGGRSDNRPAYPQHVPNINQVVSGAFVSIVLKADQPTGREVQGVVADVLTSGNHPRGIKVRLVDGRVGRVQRMVTEEEARAGSAGLSGLGRNGETGGQRSVETRPFAGGPSSGSRINIRYRDVREEEEMNIPSGGYSLGDFLPPGHPLAEDSSKDFGPDTGLSTAAPDLASATQTCPVCGNFEGDEVAVSRHVDTHFD
ncbi:hypothetical protein K490DRAFT_75636 [Saccharata proteae CBS 121410]|uniref:UBZ4-type domain-containing protein n=1 Tax=Saccharata proteae CBS 121410 TaxID=1314787 RepID=A0A9P4HQ80_9PEZI|nr:hypothetical protein K490DRAFT_75636 [Saccharata proteae CBS 121410]